MTPGNLVFALNGERVELQDVDPSGTLVDYLRLHSKYKGTKLACGEGGCGACTVLVSRFDPASKTVKEVTANSCLLPLGNLHLRSVTTTEGLGSQKDGFHPVQKRLAGFHGSQCGFCTPGMVMSMYGKIKEKQRGGKNGSGAPLGQGEVEAALQGNLCRCTGYRPILDACKSFAGDVDVEDLGLSCFRKDLSTPPELPPYDPSKDPPFPEFLLQETGLFSGKGEASLWLSAGSLEELFELMAEHKGKDIKLVVGNTSRGYYKDERPEVYIDIKNITQLQEIHHREDGLLLGASVTIADAITAFEEPPPSGKLGGTRVRSPFAELAAHLRQVATPQVRHVASIAGNLILAQSQGFPSDLAPILWGCGARLFVSSSAEKTREVTVEQFLEQGLQTDEVLVSILVPAAKALSASSAVVFNTYRAATRKKGNAVAYINAAFRVELEPIQGAANGSKLKPLETSTTNGGSVDGVEVHTPKSQSANGGDANGGEQRAVQNGGLESGGVSTPPQVVKDIVLVFGALGETATIRAGKTETALRGKELSARVLLEGLRVLEGELSVGEKDEYQLEVAAGFVYRFFAPYVDNSDVPVLSVPLSVSRGQQTFAFSKEHFPVSEPRQKNNVELQASGEAVFVDDVRAPANLLYAAFVSSEKALAHIKGIDASAAVKMPGVVGFVGVDDIPGRHVGVVSQFAPEEALFATDKVEFACQPLGLIVADSPRHASEAAKSVRIEYDTSKLGVPVLDPEQATEFIEWMPFVKGLIPKKGDHMKGLGAAPLRASGKVRCGSQQHFYMEPQTALAIPDEDKFMTVYSSCQGPAFIAGTVTALLGVPEHSVRVITRRVGGGFGGKVSRAAPIAAAAALAARKFNRPVRLTLDRNTDMKMTGGREPIVGDYEVGFTEEGKITSLGVKVLINCGWNKDLSDVAAMDMTRCHTYNIPNMGMEIIGCKTNVSTKTTVRAPGRPQNALLFETIVAHVAAIVKKPTDEVQEANFFDWKTLDEASMGKVGSESAYALPSVWKSIKESSNYQSRAAAVAKFNQRSRWQKRGIAITPVVFDAMNFPRPARISIFHDGSVIIDSTGIEMGQGLHTKVLQAAAYALNEPLGGMENGVDFAKMRIVDQDSHNVVNAGVTAGSTTSEGSSEAVRRCCEELKKRLKPCLDELKKAAEGKPVTWLQLIKKAAASRVHLSAEVLFNGMTEDKKPASYFIYGAAVSEVEVDVLTGAFTPLRTDILFDAGKSLNPAVDIGQVEGAFVQGMGFFTTEEVVVNSDGICQSDGTWTYKIPSADSIPRDFRVELLQNALNNKGILSSKASGEPPLQLACSIHSALRQAIGAAREDILGPDAPFFQLDAPATMARIKAAIGKDVVSKYLEGLVTA